MVTGRIKDSSSVIPSRHHGKLFRKEDAVWDKRRIEVYWATAVVSYSLLVWPRQGIKGAAITRKRRKPQSLFEPYTYSLLLPCPGRGFICGPQLPSTHRLSLKKQNRTATECS